MQVFLFDGYHKIKSGLSRSLFEYLSHKRVNPLGAVYLHYVSQLNELPVPLIAVLTHSLVVHFFTQLAIPVSSSQAIVGAVAGVGLVRGVSTVNARKLWAIFSAWFLSPVVAALLAIGIALALGIR